MLGRILSDSLLRRRRRKLLTLAAVSLGVTVATGVGTIALDVGDKVSRELRSFGANVVVEPAGNSLAANVAGVDVRSAGAGAALAESDLVKLKTIFWKNNIVAFAPYFSVPVEVARTSSRGSAISKTAVPHAVLVGTWFDHAVPVDKSNSFRTGVADLHPAWKLQGAWPGDGEVVVGRRLAKALELGIGERLSLRYGGSEKSWTVRGILETGGAEDDELLAPLAAVQALAGAEGKVERVEVSALTKPDDEFARSDVTKLSPEDYDRWYCTPYAASIAYQIEQAVPDSQAHAVYPVADTEGKILDRFGMLMAAIAAAALLAAGLAVASMMLATVLEREVEIGIFKSLGATDARVAAIFLIEAGVIGLAGGGVGYLAGSFAAWRLSLSVFGTPVEWHWLMLPAALGLAVLVTLVGSAWPLGRGLKVSPAVVLRG